MRILLSFFTLVSIVLNPICIEACSNIFVNAGGYQVVARTMDFPFNSGNDFGVGFVGQKNVSNTVVSQVPDGKTAAWTNTKTYIGQTWLNGPVIVDGMNDAGVSAAFLYLPDITQYPTFNEKDSRDALTFYDSLNFVLSQASSVDDALNLLSKVQLVGGALSFKYKGESGYLMKLPGHLSIRDKTGRSAVVEAIGGKIRVYAKAGPVLTNSPAYDWQVKNAGRYDYVQGKNNINARFDGLFMNGSGFIGIPGDWTPPHRFARATQIIKNLPMPQNNNEAIRLALGVLESVQVPVGSSDSPSFWKTVSDLNHDTYYYYPMYTMSKSYTVMGKEGAVAMSPELQNAWQKYNVKRLAKNKTLPKGMIPALITRMKKQDIKKIVNWLVIPTPGPKEQLSQRYKKEVDEALMVTMPSS